jgi:Protein of unknown function (DUF541)
VKSFLTAALAVSLLVAAPAAYAEVTQTESIDTVSVVGIGRVPISPTANPVEADTTYHAAMVQAVGDGLLKAQMIAGAAGAKVGPVEAISEGGRDFIECKNAAGETGRGGYKGAEPDSGTAIPPTIAVEPAAPPRAIVVGVSVKPKTGKKKGKAHRRLQRKRHGPLAREAAEGVVSCEIGSELSIIYDLEVPS